jgi:hypothetical protein
MSPRIPQLPPTVDFVDVDDMSDGVQVVEETGPPPPTC